MRSASPNLTLKRNPLMSTSAQIHANRENAQLSTGPKTEAGKARVSRNAFKHGFTSSRLFVRSDEQEEFVIFESALYTGILPKGAPEDDLYARILHACWNLRRVRELEEDLWEQYADPLTDEEACKKMEIYARHTARFERSYERALRQIRILQTDRLLKASALDVDEEAGAVTDMAKVVKQTQSLQRRPSLSQTDIEKFLCSIPIGTPLPGINPETGAPIA